MKKQAAPTWLAHHLQPSISTASIGLGTLVLEHRLRTLPVYIREPEKAQGKTQPLVQVPQGNLLRSLSGQDSWISHLLLPFVHMIWLHSPLPVGP